MMNDETVYVATIGLGRVQPSKPIKKGDVVPKDYPRFNEGIRRGWIVKKSAAPVKPSKSESGDSTEDAPPSFDPFEGMTLDSPISDLDFLSKNVKEKLVAEGFEVIRDFEGHTKKELLVIDGLGKVKATEILNAFDAIKKRN